MRILLVDSHPLERWIVRTNLEKHIHAEVIEASSETEARHQLYQKSFDIVISDRWVDEDSDRPPMETGTPGFASFFVLFSADTKAVSSIPKTDRCSGVLKPDIKHLLNRVTEACCINFFS